MTHKSQQQLLYKKDGSLLFNKYVWKVKHDFEKLDYIWKVGLFCFVILNEVSETFYICVRQIFFEALYICTTRKSVLTCAVYFLIILLKVVWWLSVLYLRDSSNTD